MKVQAHLKNYRMSPRKVRPVANLVKGLPVSEASDRLLICVNKPAEAIAKLIASAVANAENNFQLDKNALFVKDCTVHEGMKLKRWMPRAQGRATRILKRMSHITVVLETRSEDSVSKSAPKDSTMEKKEKRTKKVEKKSEKEGKNSAKAKSETKGKSIKKTSTKKKVESTK
jgi:large subunit ribosomal protein L22